MLGVLFAYVPNGADAGAAAALIAQVVTQMDVLVAGPPGATKLPEDAKLPAAPAVVAKPPGVAEPPVVAKLLAEFARLLPELSPEVAKLPVAAEHLEPEVVQPGVAKLPEVVLEPEVAKPPVVVVLNPRAFKMH